jgi:hypothetical protein
LGAGPRCEGAPLRRSRLLARLTALRESVDRDRAHDQKRCDERSAESKRTTKSALGCPRGNVPGPPREDRVAQHIVEDLVAPLTPAVRVSAQDALAGKPVEYMLGVHTRRLRVARKVADPMSNLRSSRGNQVVEHRRSRILLRPGEARERRVEMRSHDRRRAAQGLQRL